MAAGLRAGVAHVDLLPQLAKDFSSRVSKQIGGPLDAEAKRSGQRFGATFGKLASAAAGLFMAKIGIDKIRESIDAASDLNETVSKSRTIFGTASVGLEKWASGADRAIGQSKQQALDAAGTFGNLFVQLGIGSDKAAGMSTAMVELASDFASFHNADVSEVIGAQTAAFRGEYDALQRFLPLINAATVEQRALEMTGKKTTKELTAQEKALAVQKLMLEGAGAAAGDFARTSDGLANKQRIAAAQVANLKAKVGNALLPVMTTLVGFLSDKALPALETLGAMAGQVFDVIFKGDFKGGPFSEDSGFIGSLFDAREAFLRFVDYVRANVLPVLADVASFVGDHLKPILAGVGLVAALIFPTAFFAAIALAYVKVEGFRNVVDGVISFFTGTVIPAVAAFARGVADQFGNLVGWARRHWDAIREAVGHVMRVIREVVGVALDVLSALWRAWGDDLLRIAKTVWSTVSTVVKSGIDFVRNVIEGVLALINGDWGKAWNALKGALGAVWNGITAVVSGALNVLKSLIGGILSTIGVVWSGAWDKVKDLAGAAWNKIRETVSKGIGDVVEFARGLPGRILDTLSGLPAKMIELGKDLIRGMINGVKSMAGGLVDAAKGVVTGAVDSVKGFLGISSPSKLFKQLGIWTMEGLALGINEGGSRVQHAADAVAQILAEAAARGASVTREEEAAILSSLGNIRSAMEALSEARKDAKTPIDELRLRELELSLAQQEYNEVVARSTSATEELAAAHERLKSALDTTLGGIGSVLGRRDAQRRLTEAEEELEAVRRRQRALPNEIYAAEARLADLREDETATSEELATAARELRDLRLEQASGAEALEAAELGVVEASLAAVNAEQQLADAGRALIALGPEQADYFRTLATEAGLTQRAIDGLLATMRDAHEAGHRATNRAANRTPSGSIEQELRNIARFVGETWSAGKIDRIAQEIRSGRRTIDDVVRAVDRRINKRADGGPTSGLTLVGEDGAELLATGPARVHSSEDLTRMFSSLGDDDRRAEKHYHLEPHGPYGNDLLDVEEQFRRMEILTP